MARKVLGVTEAASNMELKMNPSPEIEPGEEELKELIKDFYDTKSKAKALSSKESDLNAKIKAIMLSKGITNFDFDDYKVKCTTVETCRFDEDVLLACVKEAGKKDLIRTREYVDQDLLEAAIYKGELDAALLAPAQRISNQIRLDVKYKPSKR